MIVMTPLSTWFAGNLLLNDIHPSIEGMIGMDILSLLTKAGDIGRPGARNILPTASLILLIAGLVAAGAPARYPSTHRTLLAAQRLSVIGFGLLVLTIGAMSIFLQPVISGLVAVLQDKSSRPLIFRLSQPLRFRAARKLEVLRHKLYATYDRLADQQSKGALTPNETSEVTTLAAGIRQFPRMTRVRATKLGNVLASAEEDAGSPYELDARVALPRLELLLPDSAEKQLTSRRDDCFFAARFCATLILATLFSGLLLAGDGVWLIVPTLAAVFAWLSYLNAIAAAVSYAEMLRVVFDLYRFLLYEAYHLETPKNLAEEREMGRMLTRFMQVGIFPGDEEYLEWHSARNSEAASPPVGNAES